MEDASRGVPLWRLSGPKHRLPFANSVVAPCVLLEAKPFLVATHHAPIPQHQNNTGLDRCNSNINIAEDESPSTSTVNINGGGREILKSTASIDNTGLASGKRIYDDFE